ncbi:hypothetical protein SNEBB_008439 [Seison nebaliae]|nr:hypothetical protein SNEBB_008439 [Seison nebaliae]
MNTMKTKSSTYRSTDRSKKAVGNKKRNNSEESRIRLSKSLRKHEEEKWKNLQSTSELKKKNMLKKSEQLGNDSISPLNRYSHKNSSKSSNIRQLIHQRTLIVASAKTDRSLLPQISMNDSLNSNYSERNYMNNPSKSFNQYLTTTMKKEVTDSYRRHSITSTSSSDLSIRTSQTMRSLTSSRPVDSMRNHLQNLANKHDKILQRLNSIEQMLPNRMKEKTIELISSPSSPCSYSSSSSDYRGNVDSTTSSNRSICRNEKKMKKSSKDDYEKYLKTGNSQRRKESRHGGGKVARQKCDDQKYYLPPLIIHTRTPTPQQTPTKQQYLYKIQSSRSQLSGGTYMKKNNDNKNNELRSHSLNVKRSYNSPKLTKNYKQSTRIPVNKQKSIYSSTLSFHNSNNNNNNTIRRNKRQFSNNSSNDDSTNSSSSLSDDDSSNNSSSVASFSSFTNENEIRSMIEEKPNSKNARRYMSSNNVYILSEFDYLL